MAIEAPSEPIDAIRKRFDREWLLIAVDELNALTTIPLRGHLIAHSPARDILATQMFDPRTTPSSVNTVLRTPHPAPRTPTQKHPSTLLYLTRSDHRLPDRHASAF